MTSNAGQEGAPFQLVYSGATNSLDALAEVQINGFDNLNWEQKTSNEYILTLNKTQISVGDINIAWGGGLEFTQVISLPDKLYIINEQNNSINFPLDSLGLFTSSGQILSSIRAMPEYTEDNLPLCAWKWLRDNSYHSTDNFSGLNDFLNPYLFINSLGGALCGGISEIFANIMNEAGYSARIWTMNGHTVSEVLTNQGWQIYDVDTDLIYLNASGEVASYDYISTHPDDPYAMRMQSSNFQIYYEEATINPNFFTSLYAKWKSVLPMYASVIDNEIYSYQPQTDPFLGFSQLPAQSWAQISDSWKKDVRFNTVSGDVYQNQFLEVHFSELTNFTFNYPLLLADVTGTGVVTIGQDEFNIGSEQLKQRIDSLKGHVGEFSISTIQDSQNTVVFILADNRFSMPQTSVVL